LHLLALVGAIAEVFVAIAYYYKNDEVSSQ
jgi:hypothetical protein